MNAVGVNCSSTKDLSKIVLVMMISVRKYLPEHIDREMRSRKEPRQRCAGQIYRWAFRRCASPQHPHQISTLSLPLNLCIGWMKSVKLRTISLPVGSWQLRVCYRIQQMITNYSRMILFAEQLIRVGGWKQPQNKPYAEQCDMKKVTCNIFEYNMIIRRKSTGLSRLWLYDTHIRKTVSNGFRLYRGSCFSLRTGFLHIHISIIFAVPK